MDGRHRRVPGETQGGVHWWRRRRPNRMQAGLVALSSAAIASVYAVGYVQWAARPRRPEARVRGGRRLQSTPWRRAARPR